MEPVTHFLNRRLHRPRRIQSQDRICHAGRSSGRRSRRPRHPLGLCRPGRGTEASSRHHAHLDRRAVRCGRGRREQSGSSIAGAEHRRGRAVRTRPTKAATSRTNRSAERSLGLGLSRCPSSPRSATSCSTGPTTTASVRFSLSTPAGTRAASCSSPSPVLWALFFARHRHSLASWPDRPRNRRPPQRPSADAAGPSLRSAGMVVLWCWRWAEHAQAESMLKTRRSLRSPYRAWPSSPTPSIPSAGTPFSKRRTSTKPPKSIPIPSDSTATRTLTCSTSRLTLPPSKPPSARCSARFISIGAAGPWCAISASSDPGVDPPQLPPGRTWTTVEFTDLRFAYAFRGTGRPTRSGPLSGWVYIVDNKEDAGEAMDGRPQK